MATNKFEKNCGNFAIIQMLSIDFMACYLFFYFGMELKKYISVFKGGFLLTNSLANSSIATITLVMQNLPTFFSFAISVNMLTCWIKGLIQFYSLWKEPYNCIWMWLHGVMVSTRDFESCDPSLNLGET